MDKTPDGAFASVHDESDPTEAPRDDAAAPAVSMPSLEWTPDGVHDESDPTEAPHDAAAPTDATPSLESCPVCSAYLESRAVPLDVAKANGLQCLSSAESFALVRVRGHALLIPYPSGAVRLRMHEGPYRYLVPKGQPVELYVPLGTPSEGALVVTESPIKALALTAAQVPAVGLGGVSTTLAPGAEPRLGESWGQLSLPGRDIVVLFDAGNRRNPQVARACARLVVALLARRAKVRLGDLPLTDDGRDQGPDDYLHHHGPDALKGLIARAVPGDITARIEELSRSRVGIGVLEDLPLLAQLILENKVALLRQRLRDFGLQARDLAEALRRVRSHEERGRSDTRFEHREDGLYHVPSDGRAPHRIANFEAWVESETTVDDGAATTRTFRVGVRFGGREQFFDVGDAEFERPSRWLRRFVGMGPHLTPGHNAETLFLSALHELSEPERRTLYGHTGFRTIDGELVYLHAGGAIGPQAAAVLQDETLSKIDLSLPGDGTRLLEILELFSRLERGGTMGVLLAMLPFLAPLMALSNMHAAVWLYGPTGSLKSAVALELQRFFGPFVDNAFLASWSSTGPGLEAVLHKLSGVLTVVDDFAPTSTDRHDPMRLLADRTVRSIGNGGGRVVSNRDRSVAPVRPPRALVLSTAEDLPAGASIQARLLPIRVRKDTFDPEVLSAIQRGDRDFPACMHRFIAWLLEDRDRLGRFQEEVEYFRRRRIARSVPGDHRRLAFAEAPLLGVAALLEEYLDQWWLFGAVEQALNRLGGELRQDGREQDPTSMVAEWLHEAFLGRDRNGLFGHDAKVLGTLGAFDDEHLFLLPAAFWTFIQQQARLSGMSFPITQRTLHHRLVDAGLLVRSADGFTRKAPLPHRPRMLVVPRGALDLLDEHSMDADD